MALYRASINNGRKKGFNERKSAPFPILLTVIPLSGFLCCYDQARLDAERQVATRNVLDMESLHFCDCMSLDRLPIIVAGQL